MTGYASLETAIAAVGEKRIVAYETKPLDMGHFITLIGQVAQRRKAETAAHRERERANRLEARLQTMQDRLQALTGLEQERTRAEQLGTELRTIRNRIDVVERG